MSPTPRASTATTPRPTIALVTAFREHCVAALEVERLRRPGPQTG